MEDWDEDEVAEGRRFDSPRPPTDEEADEEAEEDMEYREDRESEGCHPFWGV